MPSVRRQRSRRAPAPASDARPSSCLVEPLEPRRLLAATPTIAGPFPDDGGPDQASATYLGRLNEDRPSIRAAVGAVRPNEVQDVYRVKVDRPTDLTVELHGLGSSARTKVYLMRHGETRAVREAAVARVVFHADADGRVDRGMRLRTSVDPGSYYVAVYNGEGAGPGRDKGYRLEARGVASPLPSPLPLRLSRDDARTAVDFPSISDGPQTLAGLANSGGLAVYRLTVLDRGEVSIDLDRLTGDADLTVYDGSGFRFAGVGGNGGRAAEHIVTSLGPLPSSPGPEVVFVAVATHSPRNVGYALTVSNRVNPTGPPAAGSLSPDAIASAFPVDVTGVAAGGAVALDGVIAGGVPSVYRFDLPRGGTVHFDLDAPFGVADARGYDASGAPLALGNRSIGGDAGTYYVAVTGRRSARATYRLALRPRLNPAPDPQGTFVEGRLDDGDYVEADGSSARTAADHFTFVAPATGRVALHLASADFDANLLVVLPVEYPPGERDYAYVDRGFSDGPGSPGAYLSVDVVAGQAYVVRVGADVHVSSLVGVGGYTLTVSGEAGAVREIGVDEFRRDWVPTGRASAPLR